MYLHTYTQTHYSYAILGMDRDPCSTPAEEAHSGASCSSSQFFCWIGGFSNAVFPFLRFLGKVQPGISECHPMTTGLCTHFWRYMGQHTIPSPHSRPCCPAGKMKYYSHFMGKLKHRGSNKRSERRCSLISFQIQLNLDSKNYPPSAFLQNCQ